MGESNHIILEFWIEEKGKLRAVRFIFWSSGKLIFNELRKNSLTPRLALLKGKTVQEGWDFLKK